MDSLFPYDPSSQAALEQILSSLRVLRLKAVHISVDNLMFRNLVELRIQEVMVGRDVDLVQFLSALAPASQLRTLEMISMTSYVDPGVTPAVRDFPIHFPSLETLFLAGLLSNVIHTVLGSIAPGEYRILFSASSNCLRRMEQTGGINAGINGLNIALHDHKVDTLILNNHWHPTNPSTTAALLSIMPTLTTIYFIDWVLDQGTLSALTRTTMDTHFPQFHKMHISQCVIHDIGDPTEFMAMIMSHRVQELTLGGWLGEVLDTTSDNTTVDVEITGPDMRTDPIRDWLYQNVPKLTLLEPEKDVGFKEFNTGVWQLW
ncbi:hypothetical protein FRC11_007288 [Ceratobasidium sp. 423]|nr:hypothetical protein FRC11_007288 [Ceratobasidium sp. 423]